MSPVRAAAYLCCILQLGMDKFAESSEGALGRGLRTGKTASLRGEQKFEGRGGTLGCFREEGLRTALTLRLQDLQDTCPSPRNALPPVHRPVGDAPGPSAWAFRTGLCSPALSHRVPWVVLLGPAALAIIRTPSPAPATQPSALITAALDLAVSYSTDVHLQGYLRIRRPVSCFH
ncbi:hypothetical protein CB1_000932009 [Camelus ferus]|nr:hypothetical protein CB1_000932009 [Camelus ferus]